MDELKSDLLTISEVKRQTGITAATLRLWERYDLISPVRGKNNYRFYSISDMQRIRDIVRLRNQERLPLSAIRAALAYGSGDSATFGPAEDNVPPVNTDQQPANKRTIGWKLKALRREMGMSLREVAARTGLAPSHISVLESTSTGASYGTLSKLAKCYGTTMFELNRIESSSANIQVVRGQGRLLPLYRPGLQIEQMAEGQLKMDVTKVQMDVGCTSGDEPYSHEGEEYIYVLSGQFEITFDGVNTHLLNESDSIYFSSVRLHSWRNPGGVKTELLWINSAPSF